MRATNVFLGALLAVSASACAQEEFNVDPGDAAVADGAGDTASADGPSSDTASADATCATPCRTGFACVDGQCEPRGNWSLYVRSASIAGTHKWDDTPALAEWPPDLVVCATCKIGGFKDRCSPVRMNTTTPAWTSGTATYGHLLGVADANVFQLGVEVTLQDDDSGTLETMCTTLVTPTRSDFNEYTLRGIRATCLTGLAKDSTIELVLRPGG